MSLLFVQVFLFFRYVVRGLCFMCCFTPTVFGVPIGGVKVLSRCATRTLGVIYVIAAGNVALIF